MKKLRSLVCIVLLTACGKANTTQEAPVPGCIKRISIPVTAQSIDAAEAGMVNRLFSSNGIDHKAFRYYKYVHDTFQTQYQPYTKYDQKSVRLEQYTNGLPIFTADMVYIFWNDRFHFKSGTLTNGTSLNTTPEMTLAEIRELFRGDIGRFDHNAAKYDDSCFQAEFGYYNLNAGISDAPENLVKAWRISLGGNHYSTRYPIAYYQDKIKKLIYYDNGIRTLR